jgi:hypothetical protein
VTVHLEAIGNPVWEHAGGTRWTPDLVHCRLLEVRTRLRPGRAQGGRMPKGQRPAALKGKPRVLSIKGSNVITTKWGQGILQRVGGDRYPLQVVYWMKRGVTVKPHWNFKGTTEGTVQHRFSTNFVATLSEAMGHWAVQRASPPGTSAGPS